MKRTVLLFVGSLILFTGCGRDEPSSYQVPKDSAPGTPPASMGSSSDIEAVQAAMSAHAPADTGFTAELPEGWQEKPGSGMRKVSYSIAGTSIDFYLISLAMGDLTSNVNRWRGQVALAPATADEIEQAAQTLSIGGHSARYIAIYNDEGGKGIIAAIVDLAPKYWYFTAKGSVEELKAHAADIRKFLESIELAGHSH
jgi:hypothetical protein